MASRVFNVENGEERQFTTEITENTEMEWGVRSIQRGRGIPLCMNCHGRCMNRPNGAAACSHGWSKDRARPVRAEPVDSIPRVGPPRPGRRRGGAVDTRKNLGQSRVGRLGDPPTLEWVSVRSVTLTTQC